MIDPYDVAARLSCRLTVVVTEQVGFSLPVPSTAIQHRMGPGVYACAGVGVSITTIQPTQIQQNCPVDPRYSVEVTIARDCAVEFTTDGQTIDPIADRIAREMSTDAGVLWHAYNGFAPLVNFQINGGLALTTAAFQVTSVWGLEPCAQAVPAPVEAPPLPRVSLLQK